MGCHFTIVGSDVGALAIGIEQVAVGLAVRADAIADTRTALDHAHRVAGRRDLVDLDIVLAGLEVFLLDVSRQAALFGDRETGGDLHGTRAILKEAGGIGTGENTTGRNDRNVEIFVTQVLHHLGDDGGQVVLCPVQAESEVAAGQRPFDHDVVRQAVGTGALLEEELQGAHRGNDDAQLGIAETRVLLDQREGAEMQAGSQRDAVDTGIERSGHADLERLFRRVHGQLFHAVDEDQAIAALACHGGFDVQLGRLLDTAEVELDRRLVFVEDVVLVERELFLDVLGFVAAIGDRIDHGIRDVPDTAQTSRLEGQVGRRNINPHAADHDRHELVLAKPQAEIIHTLHLCPYGNQPPCPHPRPRRQFYAIVTRNA